MPTHFLRKILTLLITTSYLFVNAQQNELSFRNYTVEDGMASNYIKSVWQDSRGFIWISTPDGLSRFDGTSFKNYHHSSINELSLPSDDVNQVVEFKTGHLLLASHGGSICLNTFTNRFYKPGDSLLDKAGIWSFAKDKKGGIWLAFVDYLLYVDSNLNVIKKYTAPASEKNFFMNVAVTNDETVIVKTSRFYAYLDRQQDKFLRLQRKFKDKLPADFFLFYDPARNRIVGSEWVKTVCEIDLNNNSVHYWNKQLYPEKTKLEHIPYAFMDRENNIWFSKSDDGILFYDRSNDIITHIQHDDKLSFSLISDRVNVIYEDSERNIWIGTCHGLSKLSNKMRQFNVYRKPWMIDGKSADIYNIKKGPDGKIYVATFGNGSFSFDSATGESKNLDRKIIPFAWGVNRMGDSMVMTGHSDKILYYDIRRKNLSVSNIIQPFFDTANLIVFAYQDSYGDNWWSINMGNGLIRQPHNTDSFERYYSAQQPAPFTQPYFMSIKEDENGNIWLALNKDYRLVCWIRKEKRFITINPFELKTDHKGTSGITSLLPDKKGNVWIATYSSGLLKYDSKTHVVTSYTIENGLSSNAVYSLALDKSDRLWIGTFRGISCLLPATEQFYNFSKFDGLPGDEFNENSIFFDNSGNRMYMPSGNMVISFDPDSLLHASATTLPVYLDEIFVNGVKKDIETSGLRLKYNENNLQINFTAIDLSSSRNVMFAYKLEGADDGWKYTTSVRTAVYDALPAGTYKFRLKVKNAGTDAWNELNRPLQINIHPIWWQTWWFKVISALLFAALAYYLVRTIIERKLEKQRIAFEKQKAIEAERGRISSELHDDLGSGISTIRLMTEMMKNPDYALTQNEYISHVSQKATELVQSMNEIVWALNVNNDNLPGLLAYIRQYAVKCFDKLPIRCAVEFPSEIPVVNITGNERRHIFLLVKEALNNVIKHAEAKNVYISAVISKEMIITIKDDGKGIPYELIEQRTGNGLYNMQKRLNGMEGHLKIENNVGTTVIFTIPLKQLSD